MASLRMDHTILSWRCLLICSSLLWITTSAAKGPGKPKKIRVDVLNTTTIRVDWKYPPKKEDVIKGFAVLYMPVDHNGSPLGPQKHVDTLDTSSRHLILPRLVAETRFKVQVSVITHRGLHRHRSRVKVARTPPDKTANTKQQQHVSSSTPLPSTEQSGPPVSRVLTAPRHVHVQLVNSTALRVSWKPPEGRRKEVVAYKVVVADTEVPEDTETYDCRSSQHDVLITGNIERGREYSVQVYAVGRYGDGERALAENVNATVAGPPPPGSMVIEPTVEPGTSVYVTFQRVQWQPGHDSVAGYSIYYSHVTPMGMQPEIRTTVQETDSASVTHQVRIGGLRPRRRYLFRMSSYYADGEEGDSTSPQLYETPPIVPGPPRSVRAKALNASAVLVTWLEPNPRMYQDAILGYMVHMADKHHSDLGVQNLDRAEVTQIIMNSLSPSTLYYISVESYSKYGDGERSLEIAVKTRSPAPGKPLKLRYSTVSQTAVLLEWNAPHDPRVVIQEYRMYYTHDPSLPLMKWMTHTTYGHNPITTITSLEENKNYTFRVQAVTLDTRGPLSDPITVEIKPAWVNAAIISPEMEKVIITISLPKIEHYDGPVKQYLLIVVPDELAAKKPAKDYTPEEIRSATTDMYIAAKFETKLPEMFVLGDEQSYGSYINRRLKNDQTYRVFVRAYFDKTNYISSPFSRPLLSGSGCRGLN